MKKLSIMTTRFTYFLLTKVGRGGSLPGQIGLKLDANVLRNLKYDCPIILVTGTNGKTSTANMIGDLFEHAGYHVISNRRGDNMKEGIATTILTNTSLSGKVNADAIVLETDELNVRHVLPMLPVSALVATNFFRDQLDRYKATETMIEAIECVLPDYEGELVLNGNDVNTVRLALKAPKAHATYYGLAKNAYSITDSGEAGEGKFCPKCGSRLVYEYYQYSHIGKCACPSCDFKTPDLDVEIKDIDLTEETFMYEGNLYKSPYEGMYSMYNCAAVFAIAKKFGIDPSYAREVFRSAPQPKGRNEHFEVNGTEWSLNLVKNTTGANEVLKVVEKDKSEKAIILVLNDNESDGTDVSWIYDTAFEKLMDEKTKLFVCSGLRGNDMALRLYYGGYQGPIKVIDSLDEVVKTASNTNLKVYAIANFTALLPTRNAILKEMKS